MSFAGFAGLYLALRPQDAAWKEYEVAQVRTIIVYGLTALFGSLLIVPLADLIDESLALRVMSAGLLVTVFYGHQVRSDTSWTRWPKVRCDLSRRALIIEMAPFVLVAVADQVMLLANLVAPTEGLYQLALILILATPALVFVTVVSRFGSDAEG
jgi:predicted transporter